MADALLLALKKVGGAWKLLVLRELLDQPRRFGDLRKALPGISATSLARVLKSLENAGLIKRTVLPTRPVAVSYSVLHDDPNLRKVIDHLMRWGQQYAQRYLPPKA